MESRGYKESSLQSGVKRTNDRETDDVSTDLPRGQAGSIKYSRLDSYSSVTSVYSANGGQGNYPITGKVKMGVFYKNGTLTLNIVKAEGLAGAKSGGISDPYVKTYLLPDRTKHSKRKTGIHRKTTNPEYNQELKNKLPESKKDSITLWVSVWDWDRFGRNQFLGGFKRPLKDLLDDPTNNWYSLEEKKEDEEIYKGKLNVAIMYTPSDDKKKGSLSVSIKEALELPEMDPCGRCTDANVKIYLLPKQNSPCAKKKTTTVRGTKNHVWNEVFEYKSVSFEDLETNRVLEMTVWDYDTKGCNDFIGCLRLGPNPNSAGKHRKEWMDSREEEVKPWEEMLNHPSEWVECCLDLRHTIQNLFTSGGSCSGVLHRTATLEEELPKEEESYSDEESPYGSNLSLYSEGCTKGDYEITGEVCLSLAYEDGKFRVEIHNARGLAAADSNGLSDPYIKTYLLPDKSKHSKRKSVIRKKTLNPIFDEIFWYEVNKSKLSSCTLWLTVWDWDKLGKNSFLGEVKKPLSDINLSDSSSHWYPLQDDMDEVTPFNADRGKLRLGLMFEPVEDKKGKIKGTLHIDVKNAKSLPNMDEVGLSDGFVKLYLLPDKRFRKRKKTLVIKDNLNPVWNEKFTYENVTLDELSSERALEVTVWDHDVITSNDFIGGLRLGPSPNRAAGDHQKWMDSNGEEARHWEEMLTHQGKWVECLHSLRASMDPRDFVSVTTDCLDDDDNPISFRRRATNVISQSGRSFLKQDEEKVMTKVQNEMPLGQSSKARRNIFASNPLRQQVYEDYPLEQPLPAPRKISLNDPSISKNVSLTEEKTPDYVDFECVPGTDKLTLSEISSFPIMDNLSEVDDPVEEHSLTQKKRKRHTRCYSQPERELSKMKKEAVELPEKIHHGMDLASSFTNLRMRDGTQGDSVHIYKDRSELLEANSFELGSITNINKVEICDEEFDIGGEVLFGFFFKGSQLLVNIERAQNLATTGSELPNPYIETHLLPSTRKHSKKRTEVKRNTCDPIYNHQVKYKLSHHELTSYTLWLSVWDWNKSGKKFLGEVRFPLSSVNLTDSTTQWHKLHDKVHGNEEGYKGELKIAMKYEIFSRKKGKTKGNLYISFVEARNLYSSSQHVDSIVKCCLLPDKVVVGRKKTSVIKDNHNPVWEEIFTYEKLDLDELANERVLELIVWDLNKGSSNEFIGGLRLGPAPKVGVKHKEWMDSISDEVSHWESVMTHPGEWIEVWHTLRATMDYRNV